MKRITALLLCAGLISCASDGPPQAAERRAAALTARSASAASQNGYWKQAAAHWADAALRYSRIDDWTEAGYAQLGAAQARDKLGDADGGKTLLNALLASNLYPAEVKAEAQFQLAVWAIRQADHAAAQAHLDEAERLAAPDIALRAAIHNSRARLAATQGNWAASRAAASAALTVKTIAPSERANALRRQAEAAWHLGDVKNAVLAMNEALKLDRELARPNAIRDDHCLLATMLAGAAEGSQHSETCATLTRLQSSER